MSFDESPASFFIFFPCYSCVCTCFNQRRYNKALNSTRSVHMRACYYSLPATVQAAASRRHGKSNRGFRSATACTATSPRARLPGYGLHSTVEVAARHSTSQFTPVCRQPPKLAACRIYLGMHLHCTLCCACACSSVCAPSSRFNSARFGSTQAHLLRL